MRFTTSVLAALICLAGCDAQKGGTTEPVQKQVSEAFVDQVRISTLRHELLDSVDRTEVPFLSEFLELYPNAIIRYLSFADADFPSFSVTTTLHSRYEFNMRVPVQYSEDSLKITGYGNPRCYLLEIESVTPRGDELGGTSGGDLQQHFEEAGWNALVESKGDFSAIGYEVKVDKPVPNFDLVIKHLKSQERQAGL